MRMKLPLIHRRNEGEVCRNGINWTVTKISAPLIVFKMWRLTLYFRRRSDYLMLMSEAPTKRYVFGFDWTTLWSIGSIRPDFERRGIIVDGVPISLEFMEDVLLPIFQKDQKENIL